MESIEIERITFVKTCQENRWIVIIFISLADGSGMVMFNLNISAQTLIVYSVIVVSDIIFIVQAVNLIKLNEKVH